VGKQVPAAGQGDAQGVNGHDEGWEHLWAAAELRPEQCHAPLVGKAGMSVPTHLAQGPQAALAPVPSGWQGFAGGPGC